MSSRCGQLISTLMVNEWAKKDVEDLIRQFIEIVKSTNRFEISWVEYMPGTCVCAQCGRRIEICKLKFQSERCKGQARIDLQLPFFSLWQTGNLITSALSSQDVKYGSTSFVFYWYERLLFEWFCQSGLMLILYSSKMAFTKDMTFCKNISFWCLLGEKRPETLTWYVVQYLFNLWSRASPTRKPHESNLCVCWQEEDGNELEKGKSSKSVQQKQPKSAKQLKQSNNDCDNGNGFRMKKEKCLLQVWVQRKKEKLMKKYVQDWATKASKEEEDANVWTTKDQKSIRLMPSGQKLSDNQQLARRKVKKGARRRRAKEARTGDKRISLFADEQDKK